MKLLAAISIALISFSSANAQSLPQEKSAQSLEHSKPIKGLIQGVVVNQTITVIGQDFYRHFATAWADKEANERYNLTVREQPNARRGSLVWVEYAQKRVFSANLPHSRSQVQPLSEDAAQVAYDTIVEADVQRLLFQDRDLAPDEI